MEIFLGCRLGKEIETAIENAKYSINIVSPYIKKETLSILSKCKKSNPNLTIRLVTNDSKELFCMMRDQALKGNLLKGDRLIHIIPEVDIEAVKHRKRLQKIILVLCSLLFCAPILYFVFKSFLVYVVLISFLLLIGVFFTSKKYTNKRTLRHSIAYTSNFGMKVMKTFYENNKNKKGKVGLATVHSKIYIIDNKEAFIGSVNFTPSGMFYNYEALVSIKDSQAIKNIGKEFYNIWDGRILAIKENEDFTKSILSNLTSRLPKHPNKRS